MEPMRLTIGPQRSSKRLRRAAYVVAVVGLSLRATLAGTQSVAFGDYRVDAMGPIDALSRGDLHGFFAGQPLMGSFSLIVRAPFVAVAHAVGGGEGLSYTLGSLACVLGLATLAAWLVSEMGRLKRQVIARAGITLLFIFNPLTVNSLMWGHPEELLAIALAIAAVLAASRGAAGWSGVALGLAIATKQWTLVAVAPTLLAAPHGRHRLALSGACVVGALTLPGALINTHAFASTGKGIASVNSWVSTVNVWWLVSHARLRTVFDGVGAHNVVRYTLSPSLNLVPHALIVALGVPIGAALWFRQRTVSIDRALALLAMLLLARCVLDPWDNRYYHLAFLVALLAYDAIATRGLPLVSTLATVLVWATFWHVAPLGDDALLNAIYLSWTVPLAVWLLARAFGVSATSVAAAAFRPLRLRRVQAA
jgi:Glycosyltransferase family 87